MSQKVVHPFGENFRPYGDEMKIQSRPIVKESADRKYRVVVKSASMSQEMIEEAVGAAANAMLTFGGEENLVAAFVKRQFDSAHHPLWHCVVGEHFISTVTCYLNCHVLFYLQVPSINSRGRAVLLWKSGFASETNTNIRYFIEKKETFPDAKKVDVDHRNS
jgi:hypothetical protein